jgi:hypothetical protein
MRIRGDGIWKAERILGDVGVHQNIYPSSLHAPLRGARPGIRCGVYLNESPVFQYGVRGLLLSLPNVTIYIYFYFSLNPRPSGRSAI